MAQEVLEFKVNIETQNAAKAMENIGDLYDSVKNKIENEKIKLEIDGLSEIKSSLKSVDSLINNFGKNLGKGTKIDLSKMFSFDQKSFDKMINDYFDKQAKGIKNKSSSSKKDDMLLNKMLAAKKASSYPYANELNEKNLKQLSAYSRQKVSGKNEKYLNDTIEAQKEVQKLQIQIAKQIQDGADINSIVTSYDQFSTKVQEVNSLLSILGNTMEKSLDSSVVDSAISKVQKYRDSLQEVTKEQSALLDKVEDGYNKEGLTRSEKISNDKYFQQVQNTIAQQNKIAEIQREALSGSYSLTYEKANSFLSKYNGQSNDRLTKARTEMAEYKKLSDEISAMAQRKDAGEVIDSDKFEKTASKLKLSSEKMKNALDEVRVAESRTLSGDTALTSANNVQKYINENTKAWKKYKTQLEEVRDAYRSAVTEGDKSEADLKFKNIKSQISADGLTGKSSIQDFKRAIAQVSQFTGAYAIAQNVIQEVPQQIYQAVKDVNAAQIELQKVSDASDVQLVKYWDEAAESAKKYGATVSDVINSTADWSRLGYKLDEAKELSDATTLYQRVGDNMTQETASQSLISTLQGFQKDASEASSIVDEFNEVNLSASIFSNEYALCA